VANKTLLILKFKFHIISHNEIHSSFVFQHVFEYKIHYRLADYNRTRKKAVC
jgi:hypothetical protein